MGRKGPVDFELVLRDGKLQGATVTRAWARLLFRAELKKVATTAGRLDLSPI